VVESELASTANDLVSGHRGEGSGGGRLWRLVAFYRGSRVKVCADSFIQPLRRDAGAPSTGRPRRLPNSFGVPHPLCTRMHLAACLVASAGTGLGIRGNAGHVFVSLRPPTPCPIKHHEQPALCFFFSAPGLPSPDLAGPLVLGANMVFADSTRGEDPEALLG
jgi:hypothetical protein